MEIEEFQKMLERGSYPTIPVEAIHKDDTHPIRANLYQIAVNLLEKAEKAPNEACRRAYLHLAHGTRQIAEKEEFGEDLCL